MEAAQLGMNSEYYEKTVSKVPFHCLSLDFHCFWLPLHYLGAFYCEVSKLCRRRRCWRCDGARIAKCTMF